MVITRFAPSPTGNLHIGGARTALFNWLYAKNQNGKFLLRIEDTDKVRSEQKYVESILESLDWLGISHDDSLVYQSERTNKYKSIINKLLEDGHAYYCNCSKEELDHLRTSQQKQVLNLNTMVGIETKILIMNQAQSYALKHLCMDKL